MAKANELFTTTAEADAVLVRFDGPPQIGEPTLIRKWPHIDKKKAGGDTGLVETLWAVDSYEDPKANGVEYWGNNEKWRNSRVWTEDEPAGGVTIYQELKEGWITGTTEEDLPTALLVEGANLLFTPFGVDPTSEKETRVYKYRGIDPDSADTIAKDIDLTGGTIEVRITRESDGSCAIWKLTEAHTWVELNSRDKYNIRVAEPDTRAPVARKILEFPKVSLANAKLLRADLEGGATHTYITDADVSGYSLAKTQIIPNVDGSHRLLATYCQFEYEIGGSETATYTDNIVQKRHNATVPHKYDWRTIPVIEEVKVSSSATTAGTHAGNNDPGSKVRYLGNGKWLSVKRTAGTPTSWNTSDPWDGGKG